MLMNCINVINIIIVFKYYMHSLLHNNLSHLASESEIKAPLLNSLSFQSSQENNYYKFGLGHFLSIYHKFL